MEFSSLPELQSLITNLLTNQKCSCHFLNPVKTRILLWKEIKAGQTLYHLRIGIQKFSSQEQLDRNGEIYWRFGLSEVKKSGGEGEENQVLNQASPTPSELDPITKFQQRQTKTEQLNNHGKSNSTFINSSE